MKKLILILIFTLFVMFSLPVCAESGDDILKASGADELYAGDALEAGGVSFERPESIFSLTPDKIWEIIKDTVTDKLSDPLKLMAAIMTLIILASLAESAGGTIRYKEAGGIFRLICILACAIILTDPVCRCLDTVTTALEGGSEFMLGFVPVLSGLMAAGGHVTSAGGYSFAVLGFSEAAIKVSSHLFIPMLSMCICIAIADACCDGINLTSLLNGVKKIVTWGLGLVTTIFTGLLSIQSIVAASADSVSLRTAKFLLSNTVPLVGAAASEAYATVKGSISVMKNGVGGIGIASLAFILLPPLIETVLYKLIFSVLGITADVFGSKKLSALFKNMNAVLSAALGILICFMLMFIISTGVMMTICKDAV